MSADEKVVLLDLDSKEVLKGDYIICNKYIFDSIVHLRNFGINVIDCSYNGVQSMTLKEDDVAINIDPNKSVEDISKEIYIDGYNNDELRITTNIDYEKGQATYACFEVSPIYIEVQSLDEQLIDTMPNGVSIKKSSNGSDIYIIKVSPTLKYDELYEGKIVDCSPAELLRKVVKIITGEPVLNYEYNTVDNGYGYDYLALDRKTNNCIGGKYISVDALMVPIIQELESKGCHTTSSCSGHWSILPGDCLKEYNSQNFDGIFHPEPWIFISSDDDKLSEDSFSNLGSLSFGPKISKYGYRICNERINPRKQNGLFIPIGVLKQNIYNANQELLEYFKYFEPIRVSRKN